MPNDLERSLRALSGYVEMPAERDLSAGVLASLGAAPAPRRPWWGRPAFALAAIVILAAAATLALSAPAREAVADLLGIGGVSVEFSEPDETGAPLRPGAALDLGEETTLEEARGELDVGVPSELGQPDAVYVDRDAEARVSLVYGPRPGIPEAEETGVGVLLTQFRSTLDAGLFKKLLDQGVEVSFESVGGNEAYWIEGQHELLLVDDSGNIVPDTARLAGNTLIWVMDGITVRLEADISLTKALQIAGSVR